MRTFLFVLGLLCALACSEAFHHCAEDADHCDIGSNESDPGNGNLPPVFDNCDDDDESCNLPLNDESEAQAKADEFKNAAVYQAVTVLKDHGFKENDAKPLDDSYPSHLPNTNNGRQGKGVISGIVSQAWKVLNIFGLYRVPVLPDSTVSADLVKTVQKAADLGKTVQKETAKNVKDALKKFIPKPVIYNPQDIVSRNLANFEPCRNGEGICSSAQECSRLGGTSIGTCGNCLGCSVCCKYVTGCQGRTDKLISYFQSPGYPNSDRRNEACSLTVNVKPEVCQVRLDFIDFEMAVPLDGTCAQVDNLEIINTAQPGGVLGPGSSMFCGINSGQHVYLPVKAGGILILKATTSGVNTVPLAPLTPVRFSGDTAFRWNIKTTQIPCEAPAGPNVRVGKNVELNANIGVNLGIEYKIPTYFKKLRAPDQCRQYFQDGRGSIQSFNFDGQSEIGTGLNYAVCIERPFDGCGVTLSFRKFSFPASAACIDGTAAVDGTELCCTVPRDPAPVDMSVQATEPGPSYFGFSATSDGASLATQRGNSLNPNIARYYFCGATVPGNILVSRSKGPMVFQVVTPEFYWAILPWAGATAVNPLCDPNAGNVGCVGFYIDYNLDRGTC